MFLFSISPLPYEESRFDFEPVLSINHSNSRWGVYHNWRVNPCLCVCEPSALPSNCAVVPAVSPNGRGLRRRPSCLSKWQRTAPSSQLSLQMAENCAAVPAVSPNGRGLLCLLRPLFLLHMTAPSSVSRQVQILAC